MGQGRGGGGGGGGEGERKFVVELQYPRLCKLYKSNILIYGPSIQAQFDYVVT